MLLRPLLQLKQKNRKVRKKPRKEIKMTRIRGKK